MSNKENHDPKYRLLDENDPSLTFLNTHVEGHDGEKGTEYIYNAKAKDSYEEEIANEFAADESHWHRDNEQDDIHGKGIGTMALVLSITSLFFVPLLLGPAGVICGFIALRKGARALGLWSMAVGVVSVASTLIFSPFLQ
ncbi:hypothetical protein JOC54_001358 [Alkalihalobacillus xiaoxiensis]|uniref:DUF4190 domain-containing protein n=1 Tax=Shouchella xiaoxiensis TaxID=766895 RepID=A0ABS2SRJ6_9BACI|nr:hypothetical protein [Shouchella xiaoxiensis]